MVSSLWINKIRSFAFVLIVLVMAGSPVYTALAEMQATPIVEPTPTVEPVTPESTEPAGTPDGTPDMRSESVISPLAIDEVTGRFTKCTQTPESEAVYRGQTINVECMCELSSLLCIGILPSMRLSNLGLPEGFSATMYMLGESFEGTSQTLTTEHGGGTLSWNLSTLSIRLRDTFRIKVFIEIVSPDDARYKSYPDLGAFRLCYRTLLVMCGSEAEVSLSTQVAPLQIEHGEDFDLQCLPLESELNQLNDTHSAECSLSADSDFTGYQLRIDDIDVTIDESSDGFSGWSVGLPEHPDPPPMVDPENPYLFAINVTPVQCIAAESTPRVNVSVTVTPVLNSSEVGDSDQSPTQAVNTTFTPEVDQTALLTAGGIPELVVVQYSLTELTRTTDLTMQLELSLCIPWSGYVEMTEFTKVVDDDEDPLIVPIVTTFSHENTNQVPPGQTSITESTVGEIGTGGTSVLSGTAPEQQVIVNHTINLHYTIPANTPVGEYTSTITVTTSAGPD